MLDGPCCPRNLLAPIWRDAGLGSESLRSVVAPIAQLEEAADLKSAQCRFESDWGHREYAGKRLCPVVVQPSAVVAVSRVVTTRPKLLAAACRASSWLWA